jgi:hypothetical protein
MYRVGDEIECVDNTDLESRLTLGKPYVVTHVDPRLVKHDGILCNIIRVLDDNCESMGVYSARFKDTLTLNLPSWW